MNAAHPNPIARTGLADLPAAPEPRGRADAEPTCAGGVVGVRRLATVLAAGVVGVLATSAHAQTPRFDLVGVSSGNDYSRVYAVTDDGRAGGGCGVQRFNSIERPFLWSPDTGRADLDREPDGMGFVFSSDLSSIAGGSDNSEELLAFHRRIGEDRSYFSSRPRGTRVWGISAGGRAVTGAAVFNGDADAILWTESGGLIQLPSLGGTASTAYAATDDASLVVGEGLTTGDQALVGWAWNAQTGYRFLPNLIDGSTNGASARSITPDARVIGGWSAGFDANGNVAPIPTLWTDEGPLGLGSVPGFYGGYVTGMSDDASVAVGNLILPNWVIAASFVWKADTGILQTEDYLRRHEITSLPNELINIIDPVVSSNGNVIGGNVAFNFAQPRSEGFVAVVPGPGSILIGLPVLVAFASRRMRQQRFSSVHIQVRTDVARS